MEKDSKRNQPEKDTPGQKAEAGAKEEEKTAEREQKSETAAEKRKAEPEQKKQKPEAPEDGEREEMEKKLKETQETLEKQKDRLLRTVAEYDNFRKRTEREKASLYGDATAAAVQEFLPVADNLSRALEQKDCSAEDLRKGVEMVQRQMDSALKKLGVEEMGEEGEAFDPALHNAVAHVEDEKAGENTVTKVFQKGYKIGEKVIRHAMVQVAN